MADVAVSAVINKTVDIGANLIVKEGSQLYWLPEDIRWLQHQMRHMQSYLEDADNKQLTNPKVGSLLKEIKELAEDVEDILDTFLPKIESHRSRGFLKKTAYVLPYGYTCHKFAKEIEKIKRRVQSIDDDRRIYGVNEDNSGRVENFEVVPTPRNTALYFDEPIVIGFDKDIDELKNKLLSKQEKHLVLSIVGMPGIGKTTLAKKVFKSVRNDFECSASVSISQEPNIKGILEDVAKQVSLPKEKREENLEANLYAILQEKRYVLFLDDIWHTQTWDDLKVSFPIDFNGDSRIIITSRHTNVGRYIGGENSLHQLQPLDFQTSWELFWKLIESWDRTSQGFKNSELENIGKMLVEKCGGMPLAIVVTVGMLREREMIEIEWQNVLNNMGQDAHDKFSTILATSYKDLPIALKPCFLYLGLFPEDYEIKTSSLIRMWMAENFISGIGDIEAEDVGQDFINKLVVRNLVEAVSRSYDGRIKSIRIHDLLHSLCINLATETNFFHTTLNHLGISTVVGRVRRLSIHHQNNSLNTSTPKLRALLTFKVITSELPTFRFLRVLSLRVFRYTFFPAHIGNLSQLRYLRLELLVMDYTLISSICNLKNLETLDLGGVGRLVVPFGIWKMKKLRHLILPDILSWKASPIMRQLLLFVPQQIEVLPNLQALVGRSLSNFDPTWLLKFPNLRKLALFYVEAEVFEVICGSEQILKKVEYLDLSIWYGRRAVRLMNLSQYDKLLNLKLRLRSIQNLDELPQSNKFPPNLIKLTLYVTELREDPMKVLKELPKLRILKLGNLSYVGTTLDCSGVGSFPRLEILQLEGLEFLEELIVDEHETGGGGGMSKLRRVIIKDCPRLVTIPDSLQPKVTIIRN